MKTFEIMIEEGEFIKTTKNVEILEVKKYTPSEDAIIQAGYSVVQITTDSFLDIIKIDEYGIAYRMADCLDNYISPINVKDVWSTEFWEEYTSVNK